MKTVTFEVTAEDIRLGKKGHSYECPVALALMRAAPEHGGRVLVSGYRIYLSEFVCARTGVVDKFVRRFDLLPRFLHGLFVRPFTAILVFYGPHDQQPLNYHDL